MRIVTHEKLVKRNVAIAKYGFLVGTVLLIGAFILNIYALSRPEDVQLVTYVFAAFLVGFMLTSVGTAFQNRWGRRPDRALADQLKGLDDRYTLYNYRLGASHVLAGPNGVAVLVPRHQFGLVTFTNGKWHNPGAPRGLFFGLFARDPLGNPSAEAAAEVEAFHRFLKKHEFELPAVPQPLIVFLHPRADVHANDSPVPALHGKQLKEHIRRQAKTGAASKAALTELEDKLGLAPA